MLGLAVGIDYALFILSRHRAQLAEGLDVVESMSRALATAGSAVVFAGATVIIALAGLSVAKIPVLTVMGLGAAFAVDGGRLGGPDPAARDRAAARRAAAAQAAEAPPRPPGREADSTDGAEPAPRRGGHVGARRPPGTPC